jgi:hypothetical protein
MGNLVKIKLLNDLRLTLRWIYEWNIPPNRPLLKASFPFTIIWVVLNGRKKIDIGGNRYEVGQGDIVIIPPSVARMGFADQDDYGFFHYITLAADIRVGSLEFVRIYRLPEHIHIADSGEWNPFVAKSYELIRQADLILEHLQLDANFGAYRCSEMLPRMVWLALQPDKGRNSGTAGADGQADSGNMHIYQRKYRQGAYSSQSRCIRIH